MLIGSPFTTASHNRASKSPTLTYSSTMISRCSRCLFVAVRYGRLKTIMWLRHDGGRGNLLSTYVSKRFKARVCGFRVISMLPFILYIFALNKPFLDCASMGISYMFITSSNIWRDHFLSDTVFFCVLFCSDLRKVSCGWSSSAEPTVKSFSAASAFTERSLLAFCAVAYRPLVPAVLAGNDNASLSDTLAFGSR